MVCEDSCIKPLSHIVDSNVAIVVPSQHTTTRAYGTCKAIRMSIVGHRG